MFDDDQYLPPDHALLSWLLDRVVSIQNRWGIPLWRWSAAGWLLFGLLGLFWSLALPWVEALVCFMSNMACAGMNYLFAMRVLRDQQDKADQSQQLIGNLRWHSRFFFVSRCLMPGLLLLWVPIVFIPPIRWEHLPGSRASGPIRCRVRYRRENRHELF